MAGARAGRRSKRPATPSIRVGCERPLFDRCRSSQAVLSACDRFDASVKKSGRQGARTPYTKRRDLADAIEKAIARLDALDPDPDPDLDLDLDLEDGGDDELTGDEAEPSW